MKHMLHDEDPLAFVKEEGIHLKDVAEIAPALKPEQAEKLAKAAWEAREKAAETAEREETRFERTVGSIEKEESLFEKPGNQQEREKAGRKRYVKAKGTDLRDIEALAPFLRGEFLDSLAMEALGEGVSCEDLAQPCALSQPGYGGRSVGKGRGGLQPGTALRPCTLCRKRSSEPDVFQNHGKRGFFHGGALRLWPPLRNGACFLKQPAVYRILPDLRSFPGLHLSSTGKF